MNRKQYEDKRAALMNEAQNLLNAGKAEEAQAKMDEVAALDDRWDAIVKAQANFEAMNRDPISRSPFEMTGRTGDGEKGNEIEAAWGSDDYKNAWAKTLMGKQLNSEENRIFALVNEAYTHTTQNTGLVIPKTVTAGIWEMAGEIYPYFDDISKTYVNGVLTMIQEDTSSDAKWYDEATKTEDGKETFKEYTLSGCELSRAITVSWKLKEMAIDDFIPYIQRKMAKKMGAAAGYGATHGKGPHAADGKPEPTGTVTALLAENGTPQVVTYAKGAAPTYKQFTEARSKIKSGYAAGLAIYANSNTIWNIIANVMDDRKRPIFVPDPVNGGVYRVLGVPVKEDDSMSDGEILFSSAESGYHCNINKEMSVLPEDHVKDRTTDYCGYAIMDGAPVTTKAHALLKEAAGD